MPAVDDKSNQSGPSKSRRYAAAMTAAMIAEMDPHSREDLACYLRAFSEAAERGDVDELRYIESAIIEVFTNDTVPDSVELDDWPVDAEIKRDRFRTNEQFITRYQQFKQAAGLRTQQEVADACQLSVNTINAIETQRVKPQSRTLQKLAKGLNVSVEALLGGNSA